VPLTLKLETRLNRRIPTGFVQEEVVLDKSDIRRLQEISLAILCEVETNLCVKLIVNFTWCKPLRRFEKRRTISKPGLRKKYLKSVPWSAQKFGGVRLF